MNKYKIVIVALSIPLVLAVVFAIFSQGNPCGFASFPRIAGEAYALQVYMNARELYEISDVVAVGSATYLQVPACDNGHIVTLTRFSIEDYLKSAQEERIITIKTFGGTLGSFSYWVEDQPQFESGARYLLFLDKDDGSYRARAFKVPADLDASMLLRDIEIELEKREVVIALNEEANIDFIIHSLFNFNSPVEIEISSLVMGDSPEQIVEINDARIEFNNITVTIEDEILLPDANDTVQGRISVKTTDHSEVGTYFVNMVARSPDSLSKTVHTQFIIRVHD